MANYVGCCLLHLNPIGAALIGRAVAQNHRGAGIVFHPVSLSELCGESFLYELRDLAGSQPPAFCSGGITWP